MHVDLTSRLCPDILAFDTGQFALSSDLERLAGIIEIRAVEGAIFYCARIMEALTAHAVRSLGLPASANQTSNLQLLEDYNLMLRPTAYLAHGLRRIGNQARHLQRKLGDHEIEIALLALERGLQWFFVDYPCGPRLLALGQGGRSLEWPVPSELRAILDRYSGEPSGPAIPAGLGDEELARLAGQPTLAAIVAELLLDCNAREAAAALLDRALSQAPDDLRLGQLEALRRSHTENIGGAIAILRPLLSLYGDEETTGILAGTYKRMWQAAPDDLRALMRAQRLYRSGWERSRRSNPYLGINAASMLLWLGRPAESRLLAEEVRDLLMARLRVLSDPARVVDLELSCWDRLTLAEARLVSGDLEQAARDYAECFSRHATYRANIEIARNQADRVLGRLGMSCSLSELIRRENRSGAGGRTIHVGVTGHRSLPGSADLKRAIAQALDRIARDHGAGRPGRLTILSPLTEGADRLAAAACLESGDGHLHAVLPLELQDYLADFATEESRQEFLALLNRASRVTFPPTAAAGGAAESRRAPTAPAAHVQDGEASLAQRVLAYETCGRYVVDHCDVLLAVWDGAPAGGRGGTADVVAYARARSRPMVWVQAVPPHETTVEGWGAFTGRRPGEDGASAGP